MKPSSGRDMVAEGSKHRRKRAENVDNAEKKRYRDRLTVWRGSDRWHCVGRARRALEVSSGLGARRLSRDLNDGADSTNNRAETMCGSRHLL